MINKWYQYDVIVFTFFNCIIRGNETLFYILYYFIYYSNYYLSLLIFYVKCITYFALFHLGALQITSSEEKDHGKYECVAENSIGTDYSKHALLYVKGKLLILLNNIQFSAELYGIIWNKTNGLIEIWTK